MDQQSQQGAGCHPPRRCFQMSNLVLRRPCCTKERVDDRFCVKIFLLALSGASIESQISLNRTLFFWDRRYGGVKGEVNSFATAKGAVLVGTAKRKKSFPFTFDHTQAIHAGSSKRRAPWQPIGLLGELEETSSLPWLTGVGLAALY